MFIILASSAPHFNLKIIDIHIMINDVLKNDYKITIIPI